MVLLAVGAAGCGGRDQGADPVPTTEGAADNRKVEPVERTITVVETYAHDSAYTQGLEWIDQGPWDGSLLESAGQYGESRIRIWAPEQAGPGSEALEQATEDLPEPAGAGEPVAPKLESELDDQLFAEGATIVGDQVWQLTWQAGRAFVYDIETLQVQSEFKYEGEGWGLCLLGDRLIRSDGTDRLWFHRLDDFSVTGSVAVTSGGEGLATINELECVIEPGGTERVWANLYQSTTIVAIDPETGVVTDTVDASGLVPDGYEDERDRVLNGIAHQPDTGRFWLTGKRWPVLYEVELD